MKRILGISGRAQSGKTTAAEYIKNRVCERVLFLNFADSLKDIVEKLFGVDKKFLWTDEGKCQKTHVLWENMPGTITRSRLEASWGNFLCDWYPLPHQYLSGEVAKEVKNHLGLVLVEDGAQMTGREILEYFGTDVCRKIYEDCWVNWTISEIENDTEHDLYIIGDVRSANEIKRIAALGGRIYRLERNPNNRDTLIETQLDRANYDYNNFHFIYNNISSPLEAKNRAMLDRCIADFGVRELTIK
jgi:hypothetical protein